jgi:phosphatidate cytidylyltransferase
MLKKRIIVALPGLLLIIAAIWFDQPVPWFTIVAAIWGLLAAFEFYKMVGIVKAPLLAGFGLIWTALLIISPHCEYALITPVLLTSAVVIPLILILRQPKTDAFINWAWTLAGILYLGWLLSHFVALRNLDLGGNNWARNWVFFALFVTFASDIAAFFIGRALGKHRLAPNISPGKTREGAIGGIIGAIIISLCFIAPTPLSLPISYGQAIVLGLLVSIFGQLGDLTESLLKRNMGIKDSSQLIPGHGGFLDRIDSVVFAGVVVYYFVVFSYSLL